MSVTDSPSFLDALPGARNRPDISIEQRFLNRGFLKIAGVDEAGRGPLAGPVVAAAVILDLDNIPDGLHDSKQLSAETRTSLFAKIIRHSHVAWASVASNTIDLINIREATLTAMTAAVCALPHAVDMALIDGRDVPLGLIGNAEAFVKGDSRSLSIAAASIVAKHVRDQMMLQADKTYPHYGFAAHKGYGSKSHRDAIAEYGPCPLHRKSFAPLRHMIANDDLED